MKQTLNDVAAQTRCKSTTLATVGRWLMTQGVKPMSISALIREGLEALEKILKSNNVEVCEHIWDAREVLTTMGLDNLNPGDRNAMNLLKERQKAEYQFEGYDVSELEFTQTKKQMIADTEELIETAANVMREQGVSEEEIAARVLAAKSAKHEKRDKAEKDALASSGAVPLAHDEEWPKDDSETENDTDTKD